MSHSPQISRRKYIRHKCKLYLVHKAQTLFRGNLKMGRGTPYSTTKCAKIWHFIDLSRRTEQSCLSYCTQNISFPTSSRTQTTTVSTTSVSKIPDRSDVPNVCSFVRPGKMTPKLHRCKMASNTSVGGCSKSPAQDWPDPLEEKQRQVWC